VGRDRIIERERRWAVPAAVAAIAPLVLYIVSIFIVQRAHLVGGSSEAAQLASLDEHSGTVLVSSIVRAIGFLVLTFPVLYLFRATQARSPRVATAMIGFVFLGPVLFAAQGVVQAIGASQASSNFVKLAPEQTRTYADFSKQVKQDPTSIQKVTIYTDANSLEVQQTDDSFYQVTTYPDKAGSGLPGKLDGVNIDNDTDSDTGTGPPDAEAIHVTEDNQTITVSQSLLIPAVFGLIALLIYLSLQAMRVGLLTRASGSLGIALGASMILILPIAVLGLLVWMGYVGLTFVGKVPGGKPPAWDAGKAIPWPRPGDPASAPPGGGEAIEAPATEVNGDRQTGEASDPDATGPQKRKRKRRP
jgi:hypothetical protein